MNLGQKIRHILYHVKAHPLQEILAFEFNMTQCTANGWIHILSGVLKNALEAGGHLPSGAQHTRCRLPELSRNTKEQHDDLITDIARGLHNFRALYKQS